MQKSTASVEGKGGGGKKAENRCRGNGTVSVYCNARDSPRQNGNKNKGSTANFFPPLSLCSFHV